MGRKMVMVAGLLTNSVTMDTRMHASRVMAHGGRLLRDSIWCPIQVERPELCRPGGNSEKKGGKARSQWDSESQQLGGVGGREEPRESECLPISWRTQPSGMLDFCDEIIFLAQKIVFL